MREEWRKELDHWFKFPRPEVAPTRMPFGYRMLRALQPSEYPIEELESDDAGVTWALSEGGFFAVTVGEERG